MHHLLLLVIEEAHFQGSYGATTLASAAVRVLLRSHELLAHRVLQYILVVHFTAREDCRVSQHDVKSEIYKSLQISYNYVHLNKKTCA